MRKLSEAYEEVFKDFFKPQASIKVLLKYGVDGLTKTKSEWNWSKPATLKLEEFVNFVKRTEADHNFIEKT